ncbi:MAG: beta-lactamase family protein [Cytophagaceae bacterium]|jgi:CubicO group peptidase (beta-lactamase class C family)|nr:beta-lactamase family protein [Cytophagaceae bacterium]
MAFKYKALLLLILGIYVGFTLKYITGFNETSGIDFTPPKPEASSLRIPDFFSNDSRFSLIDNHITRYLNRYQLAGASVAIAKDGKTVFAKGYGYADKENETAVESYHLFRIASISKLITATGIMKLVEEERLSLDDKVFGDIGILNHAPYNDYFDNRAEKIEVRHLLNHSGGWTTRWGDPMFIPHVIAQAKQKKLPVSDEDIITFMLGKRLHFEPGSMSSYSNLGYAILGKVIEKVSGLNYETFIKTRILYPLGIFDMQLGGSFSYERLHTEVKYYEPVSEDPRLVEDFLGLGEKVPCSYGGNDIKTLGAAGGWVASAPDLLRFMLAIDGDASQPDILSKESVEIMANHDMNEFETLGWRGIDKESRYRTGTLSGTSTLMVCRDDGISYVILFNSSSWKGSTFFSNQTKKMMNRAITQIDEWPDYDLFELASSVNRINPNVGVIVHRIKQEQ